MIGAIFMKLGRAPTTQAMHLGLDGGGITFNQFALRSARLASTAREPVAPSGLRLYQDLCGVIEETLAGCPSGYS
jgi:hypothetical protein